MSRFLFKTEPGDYSFEDLVKERSTRWEGVTNTTALKHLRTAKEGDEVLIYHTGDERQVVGAGKIMRAPYPDPSKKDRKLVVVDVMVGARLPKPVKLEEIKGCATLKNFDLVRLPRLSVMPVSDAQWQEILRLGGAVRR